MIDFIMKYAIPLCASIGFVVIIMMICGVILEIKDYIKRIITVTNNRKLLKCPKCGYIGVFTRVTKKCCKTYAKKLGTIK